METQNSITEFKRRSSFKAFLRGISAEVKAELDQEKEFFQFKELDKISTFYAFTKTGINGINARSGTGKSLVLMEIFLYLLHTKQIKSVILVDLDDNYTTLKKRNQAPSVKAYDDDEFCILTAEKIMIKAQALLDELMTDIATLESIKTAEQLESGIYSLEYAELVKQAKKIQILISKSDFLALVECILCSSELDLKDSAIVIDSIYDILDSAKPEIIQQVFFNIFRPFTHKGASVFYLNHITKGDGSGKNNYAGSYRLESKTDYFTLISKPIKNQDLLNVEPTKDRHGDGNSFAFTYDLNASMGERLFKCDYLDSVDGFTDAQNDTLANIIKALSTGDKKHCELEKVCGRASDGANKQAFYKISQTAEFKEKIAKKQVGKNVFYSLKTKAPDIYELTDD